MRAVSCLASSVNEDLRDLRTLPSHRMAIAVTHVSVCVCRWGDCGFQRAARDDGAVNAKVAVDNSYHPAAVSASTMLVAYARQTTERGQRLLNLSD